MPVHRFACRVHRGANPFYLQGVSFLFTLYIYSISILIFYESFLITYDQFSDGEIRNEEVIPAL